MMRCEWEALMSNDSIDVCVSTVVRRSPLSCTKWPTRMPRWCARMPRQARRRFSEIVGAGAARVRLASRTKRQDLECRSCVFFLLLNHRSSSCADLCAVSLPQLGPESSNKRLEKLTTAADRRCYVSGPYKWHVVWRSRIIQIAADVLGLPHHNPIEKYLAKSPNSHSWIRDR